MSQQDFRSRAPAEPRRPFALVRIARDWRDAMRIAWCCRRLRALYLEARASGEAPAGEALYVQVVQAYLGSDEAYARRVVGMAADSYARWPTPRAVSFRDVVHYLVVATLSSGNGFVDRSIGGAVNGRIPIDW